MYVFIKLVFVIVWLVNWVVGLDFGPLFWNFDVGFVKASNFLIPTNKWLLAGNDITPSNTISHSCTWCSNLAMKLQRYLASRLKYCDCPPITTN